MANNSFRKPVMLDDDGGYITKAQIRFFMNRRHGFEKIHELHDDFIAYTEYCKIYNYLWDCSKVDARVNMVWDDGSESIAFTFPKTGTIAEIVTKWKLG